MNHIENQPELNRELLEMISGTSISWVKTKEEIWPELLGKIERESLVVIKPQTIYFKVVKYAAVAVFALLLGISAVMYFYAKTIKTTVTQKIDVFLPDNSKVMVYAQSVLSYRPLLWKLSRTVKFEGEGFFEVQKGKKFEVVSGKGKTVVLGTQFDIYSRSNVYNVNCVSGKVKVIASAHQNEAIIHAGQKAILKPDGKFEILDLNNTQPENSDETQNQTLEEELNTVLSTAPVQAQPFNKEDYKVPANKKAILNEQAINKEQDKAGGKNAIKEQNRSQSQAIEDVQNKGQLKASTQAQTGIKEQEQNQNQEKAKATDKTKDNPQNKDKFRSSLTPEQINILENQQMSKEEKRKAFLQSLSPEQRMLLQEQNKERARQTGGNDKESGEGDKMKEQQKMQMREQMRENAGKESKEQQKQQNPENKGNTKPGSGNGSGSGNGNGN